MVIVTERTSPKIGTKLIAVKIKICPYPNLKSVIHPHFTHNEKIRL